MIYNYDGKMISNPKIAGAKCNYLYENSLIHEQKKNRSFSRRLGCNRKHQPQDR